MHNEVKHTIDGISLTGAVSAFLGWLPDLLASIAALMAIVWTGIRIYEWWREKKHPPRRRFND